MPEPSTSGAPVLVARDVSKAFLGARALSNASFSISAGEIAALIGENGAGKSTVLKTLFGLLKPRQGRILLNGESIGGSTQKELLARGTGPYFYLPKLESHLEARLWNEIFVHAQDALGVPQKSIKATVLIETILATFEMDEILYELRDHSAGLNCGRWDYIFSFTKSLAYDPGATLPERGQVTMAQPFLRAYAELLTQTCHKRGAQAMGGMAAQIPIKNDPEANDAAIAKVRADKEREAGDGHDGTWVAHPGLVAIAREQFDAVLGHRKNQLDVLRADVQVRAEDLLTVPAGAATFAGLRQNLDVGVQYLEAWLCGNGCVPLHNLMEDAATAEIFATAAMMGSATAAVELLESVGLAGVFIRDNGDVVVTSTLKDFEP